MALPALIARLAGPFTSSGAALGVLPTPLGRRSLLLALLAAKAGWPGPVLMLLGPLFSAKAETATGKSGLLGKF
jgi:hypothetical protein